MMDMKKALLLLLCILVVAAVGGFLWYTDDEIHAALNYQKPNIVIELDRDNIYLAVGESITINANRSDLDWSSSDSEIATVESGIITGFSAGEVVISASKADTSESINVIVTDLITTPVIDNDKEYLKCNQYTEEEAELLDKLLAYRIDEAGYKTRAGAVAAARFLVLEFPYRISYFYENGRLETAGGRKFVDGEGRYYHVGLYLSESKFKDLEASLYGPAIWGCPLYSWVVNTTSSNGLDCSGYVSWALYNAGFDVKDGGAGINPEKDTDLDDLGTRLTINSENLDSGKVKVGDLMSTYGHIGILIGMDDEHYYVAESLDYDIHVNTYTRQELLDSDWMYVILLDEVYEEDGNLTNMW